MLVDNSLPEGTALRVEALARLLEVSPTPVREALVQLEATGLVRYTANRGYRVADLPSAEEVRQIIDARTVLEVAAARRAAERADQELRTALSGIVADQRAAAARLQEVGGLPSAELVREYLALDHAFHDLIFRECGNPFLHRLARSLDAQSQRARQSFRHGLDDAVEAAEEHATILAAIAAGDADEAEAASSAHLARVLAAALRDADT